MPPSVAIPFCCCLFLLISPFLLCISLAISLDVSFSCYLFLLVSLSFANFFLCYLVLFCSLIFVFVVSVLLPPLSYLYPSSYGSLVSTPIFFFYALSLFNFLSLYLSISVYLFLYANLPLSLCVFLFLSLSVRLPVSLFILTHALSGRRWRLLSVCYFDLLLSFHLCLDFDIHPRIPRR